METTRTIRAATGQHAYVPAVAHVLANGKTRSPHGVKTLDAGFTVIELSTPYRGLALGCGRNLNFNIAAAEAVQLIGGFQRPDLLTRASANFSRFAEEDGNFHGSYGSRIKFQVPAAIRKLRQDPHSRQAVITLWDPWLDNLESKLDYPCTVMLQFEIIDDMLCMNTVMRSNDVWLGLPYDLFQFTQLQLSVAYALDKIPGPYRHTALSLHLYETDVPKAEALNFGAVDDFTEQPMGIGTAGQPFTEIMKTARRVTIQVGHDGPLPGETTSERWYRERFASYLG